MIYLVFLIYAECTNISIIIKVTPWLVNEASEKKFQICDNFINTFCDFAEQTGVLLSNLGASRFSQCEPA